VPVAGIFDRRGNLIRGTDAVAAVQDEGRRRAMLEARGEVVNAWQRRLLLNDTKAVARSEETLNRVYVECYGRLPKSVVATARTKSRIIKQMGRPQTRQARMSGITNRGDDPHPMSPVCRAAWERSMVTILQKYPQFVSRFVE
jgi:hypothetical protein